MNKPRTSARRRVALAGLLLAAGWPFAPQLARAEGLTWLAPERASSAGFVVGLVALDARGEAHLPPREVTTSIRGGALRELAPAGPVRAFAVEPSSRAVTLEASDGARTAAVTVAVGSSAAQVRLSARPARPVKGRDGSAELAIEVMRADGQPDTESPPPIVRANVGAIENVHPLGAGRFAATYRLPAERRPEVAIVVAFAPWPHADAPEGAFGALSIPLASKVMLPGNSEPGATIRMEIAGEHFGPTTANAAGRFEIQVVVPPGHAMATSITSDPAGNQRRREVDLQLPPTDQLSCVANPVSVPVDGRTPARIICAAFDPFGAPAEDAALTGRAEQGKLLGPRSLGAGLFEWTYAPPLRGPGRDRMRFEYPAGGPQSTEEIAIELLPLPPAHADVQVSAEPVLLGSSATITLRALDGLGRPVATRPFLSAARGSLEPFHAAGEALVARYHPPDELGDWRDRIEGEVLAVPGRVPARIRLAGSDTGLRARVETLAENPVEAIALASASGTAVSDRDGRVELPLPKWSGNLERVEVWVADRPSVRAQLWRLPLSDGSVWFPAAPLPEPVRVALPVALGPATPVDVQLELVEPREGHPAALLFRVVDPHGKLLSDRDVVWMIDAEGGPVSGVAHVRADGTTEVDLPPRTRGRVRATVVDRATGVSAAQEAVLP